MAEWINVKDRLPIESGWYTIKTKSGSELPCPFVRNGNGELVWVIPDKTHITHWQET